MTEGRRGVAMTRRRGATRSQAARAAILAATSSLVERFGYDRVTVEGIASEAGVGKQTIYRWWPSKSAVVAECLLEGALLPEAYAPHDTGDIVADLTEWLQRVFDFIATPRHETMLRSLIAAAVDNPEIGEHLTGRLGASPEVLAERLRSASAARQLRPGTSVDRLTHMFMGIVFARLLLRTPAGPDDARAYVELVLSGAAPPVPARDTPAASRVSTAAKSRSSAGSRSTAGVRSSATPRSSVTGKLRSSAARRSPSPDQRL
jgi:AcrR family transcriptional regulator